jgi:DNA-binding NarL/FixJ family response regulator
MTGHERIGIVGKIRILLADDHRIMREGLCALITEQRGMEVMGEAENGRKAVELCTKLKPDVLIMDLSMPELNGIEAIGRIRMEYPDIKVLILSMHSDRKYVARALREGATGYMLKDCASEELIKAVRTVSAGRTYLSPRIMDVVLNDYVDRLSDEESSVDALLSKREREVLQLLAEGRSTKDIAHDLNVSVKTVETHRSQIMIKLDIHSIAGLTKFAVREGLVRLED